MTPAKTFRAARRIGACALATALTLTSVGCTLGGRHHDGARPAPAKRMHFAFGDTGYDATVAVPTKPIAVVHTSTEGLDFELYALRRSGKVAGVVFALHNVTDKTMNMDGPTGYLDLAASMSAVHDAEDMALVDGKNLKEYLTFVVDGQCLCSRLYETLDHEKLEAHQREYGMAQVAAPPADVGTVTVLAGKLAAVSGARISG